MPPKKAGMPEKNAHRADSQGMFRGMIVFLVRKGVQPRRLQIWEKKLMQMGAVIETEFRMSVTHVFAMNLEAVLQELGSEKLKHFLGAMLLYEWVEDSLKSGKRLPEKSYTLNETSKEGTEPGIALVSQHSETERDSYLHHDLRHFPESKRLKTSLEESKLGHQNAKDEEIVKQGIASAYDSNKLEELSLYNPPDLNRNITEIFGKLINIYRALGDDRRSFSYYKAIAVLEKLPLKIESIEQVKQLPTIGKSLQDHINEIVTTGKLSKLEHFENDEKVKTISLFGDVWGIGPATAIKLYDKGHRALDDLKNEESLTNAQKLGVRYYNDLKQKIPRKEVREMEALLEKAGEHVLPGVTVVCGGSYRRGKAFCGDLDVIVTHPDGQSHKGFLARYVKYLKDINFLKEDLVFSVHSEEGTDSGVDTYFGLFTYLGREQRHRIDFKVYPRDIYAFGLIAWTGNDVLNRRLRLLAESKGFRLDDTGLFLAAQSFHGKQGAKSSGSSIRCQTEREVFEVLGFPWLKPHERNL